jgi:Asp/Glu/hydantoin racemase
MSKQITASPRIALIHATPVAMPAIQAAFMEEWPEAVPVNLLDEGLSLDIQSAGELTHGLENRIRQLAEYSAKTGAQGIIFTCSAFGTAIEKVKPLHDLPIFKPDEAMFDRAIRSGKKIGLLATFKPAVPAAQKEFMRQAEQAGVQAELEIFCLPRAREALLEGDLSEHDSMIAQAAAKLSGLDALMLAHFSMASALSSVKEVTNCPVFASPQSAVAAMRAVFNS